MIPQNAIPMVSEAAPTGAGGLSPADVVSQLRDLSSRAADLADSISPAAANTSPAEPPTALDVFHDFIGVFLVAFVLTLLCTPLMRHLALRFGIVDRPSEARKIHRIPIAYLGGAAVYVGILGGILFSYTAPFHGMIDALNVSGGSSRPPPGGVPFSFLLGMTVIMLAGLLDDVTGIRPQVKIGLQLIAAAALALDHVGVQVAAGVIMPIARGLGWAQPGDLTLYVPLGLGMSFDLVYWTGTVIIAMAVLGACNASNLIDGLDGLLSGVTAIIMMGLLVLALGLATSNGGLGDGPRDSTRVVLCLAVMGACMGFLPHNFNPANIFLGDCGSMLLGFCSIVVILTLGDSGKSGVNSSKTALVLAGLLIYALPMIDTTLAIVRRKISGKKISDPDDQHLHHMLKRSLGVKGAAFALYGISACFAVLGVLMSMSRVRVTVAVTVVFLSFIGVISFKIARKAQHDRQAQDLMDRERARAEAAAGGLARLATRQ